MSRRVLVAVLMGAALGALLTASRSSPPERPAPPPPPPPAPVAPPVAAAPKADFIEELPPEDAGPVVLPPSGFCPAPGEDPAPYPRQSVSDFLNAQDRVFTERLRQRLASDDASTELHEAADLLADPTRYESAFQALRQAPDRRDGSFDFATRSLVRAASWAVSKEPRLAHDLAERAVIESPDDPAPYAMSAFASFQSGDTHAGRDSLRRAHALAPSDAAVAWALVWQLQQTVNLDELVEVLGQYVKLAPGDTAAAQLLARVTVQRDIQRDYVVRTINGVTLEADAHLFSEESSAAFIAEVTADLEDAARLTGTPRRSELTVVVYPGHEELLAVSCANVWASALYDGTLRVVGDVRRADPVRGGQVRHEVLHAQLTPFAPNTPFWFNEGLAMYFGEPNRRDLLAAQYKMLANRTCFPFTSLQGSFQPFQDPADALLAYAQSLAMVQYLAERGGASAIATAVDALHHGSRGDALLEQTMRHTVTTDNLLDFLRDRLGATAPLTSLPRP